MFAAKIDALGGYCGMLCAFLKGVATDNMGKPNVKQKRYAAGSVMQPTALCADSVMLRQRYAPTALCPALCLPSVMPCRRYALPALCHSVKWRVFVHKSSFS